MLSSLMRGPMNPNRPRSRTRLPGIHSLFSTLLFAYLLLPISTGCSPKPHSIDLTWAAPATSPVPVVGYNIYRAPDEGFSYHLLNTSPIKETKYTDWMVQSGRTYHYMIKSVDANGVESDPSNVITMKVP